MQDDDATSGRCRSVAHADIVPTKGADTKTSTMATRQLAHEQALASTRISGHLPSAEFLADCEAVIEGRMTRDEARAASLARAFAADKAAASLSIGAASGMTPVEETLNGLRHTEQLSDAECDEYFDRLAHHHFDHDPTGRLP